MSHADIPMPTIGLPVQAGMLRRIASGRRCILASIPVALLCIGAAGYLVVKHATDRIVRADALATVHDWSANFNRSFDSLDTLVATGQMSAVQRDFVAAASSQGKVFRFKLFDVHGRLVIASDDAAGAPADISLRDHDPEAVRVIESGREVIRLIAGSNGASDPELLAEAYVPLRDDLGELRGIIAVSVDETATAGSVSATLHWAGAALGALLVLGISIPAVAIASYRRAGSERRGGDSIDHDRAAMNATLTTLRDELEAALRQLKDADAERLQTGRLQQEAHISSGPNRCDAVGSRREDTVRIMHPEPQNVALDDWIAEMVQKEAERLPQAMVIECSLGFGDETVSFDPGLLDRVLASLLSHASEAVAVGQDARAPEKAPRITISSGRSRRGVEIVVASNGPGIPFAPLDAIFVPPLMTGDGAAAFGLPAALKIMEQHGGGIDIHSHPGQGAAFTAWWPIEARMKEAS